MSEKKEKYAPSVTIRPAKEGLELTWDFRIYFTEKSEKKSCYIPAFDIFFSANDTDAVQHKGDILTRMFFDHFMIHSKKHQGLKNLILELHKLGFESNQNYAYLIHRISKNLVEHSKFKNSHVSIPSEFVDANMFSKESKLKFADI